MVTTMFSTSRTLHRIPASTILPPGELKHYRRWQRLYSNLKPAQQGYIPTALEYEEFQQWLKRQDSGYFSDVFEDISDHLGKNVHEHMPTDHTFPIAPVCKHAVHPLTAHHKLLRCLVCSIDTHISYMKLLEQALRSAGGRAPPCTLTASDHQDNAYKALVLGKLSILKELSELEHLAEQEAVWSIENPNTVLNDVQTAQKALKLYWSEIHGLYEDSSQSPEKKKKKVVFTRDTSDEPGRPEAYFRRNSPRYEPGKYTIFVQQDDHDDLVSEDSEDYDQTTLINASFPIASDANNLQDGIESEELVDDDGDSDWEDIDEEESSFPLTCGEYGFAADDIEESASFVVFSDD